MSDWLSISQNAGTGNTIVYLTADTNNLLQKRTRTYRVYTNTKSEIVTVEQNIDSAFSVDYLTVFYNITSTGATEIIFDHNGNPGQPSNALYKYFEKYRVDGGEWIIPSSSVTSTTYTFTTTGEHYVEFVPKDYPNDIVGAQNSRYNSYYSYAVPHFFLYKTKAAIRAYVPSQLTVVGDYAFSTAPNLEYVQLHDNITYIGKAAFYSSAQEVLNIQTIDVPINLECLSFQIFCNSTNIRSVNISSGSEMTFIDATAFYLTDISSIVVPENVQIIYGSAFGACSALTTIYAYPRIAPTLTNTIYEPGYELSVIDYPFINVGHNGVLHYPAGSNYSSWLKNQEGYLGYYGWTGVADL